MYMYIDVIYELCVHSKWLLNDVYISQKHACYMCMQINGEFKMHLCSGVAGVAKPLLALREHTIRIFFA